MNFPTRIATNTYGEFLVVDGDNKTIKVFDSSGEFIYKINPQVDETARINYLADVATDVNNNTYTLVWLSDSWTCRYEVQVFTKTERCKIFPVRERSSRLAVSKDRVFVASSDVIAVYELNGTPVGSFGEGTLRVVRGIAVGSDSQIFVLNHATNNEKIAYVFTKDGHHQNSLRVDSKENDYFDLASYPSGEHFVFSGFERETRKLKVALYRKEGVFHRSVTLGERLFEDNMTFTFGIAIAVTNDGKVAVPLQHQGKVIVRLIKPC